MKVIIIKDCKDGKVNDIVEVSDGYAKNFLLKNGYAQAINKGTLQHRNADVKHKEEAAAKKLANAKKAQAVIEALVLQYELKTTNNVVHGSITKKQIQKSLRSKKVNVDSTAIENVKISSIGISKVAIKLHKDVTATLKVEVKDAK